MGRQFDRAVEVVLGTNGYNQARRFNEHRIEFEVDHQHRDKPNEASVSIWNLSQSQRAWLMDNAEVATLRAGYGGRLVDIFAGEIERMDTSYRLPDTTFKVTLGDGINVTLSQRIELSLAGGTTIRRAIDRIAGVMGVPIAFIDTSNTGLDQQFLGARSFVGRAVDALEQITQQIDLDWSIQDGQLYLISPLTTRPETAFVISSATGLVGTPEPRVKRKKNREKVDGISFKTLLLPELRPGHSLQMDSRAYKGPYKAERVIHQGDNGWNNSYYTQVEARSLI